MSSAHDVDFMRLDEVQSTVNCQVLGYSYVPSSILLFLFFTD